ncbi:GNAT family N-acetyltransferase [Saccharothrix syringae]|uniref:GNAT family N-acetyltransferase n=1 Tax=Saccharothrix syringae TaxID=103733 RepID=A0A5Q0H6G3_SACSY|nr:GNAT family N-acetyltransferase [Saccharothrix syringae]QFZ21312.1 GNAT family N-acetyltransferase [Saccharothrix syringae]
MGGFTVEPFDPGRAGEAELTACHAVMAESWAEERPDEPPLTREQAAGQLITPMPGAGAMAHWVARRRGRVVGLAAVSCPETENTDLALVEVMVAGAARGQGVGTAVLRELLPGVLARGRRAVEGWVPARGPGRCWTTALGFRPVRSVAVQALLVAGADRARWDVPVPAGYRARRWLGRAPDDLVGSYAAARCAIHDAPLGESGFRPPAWTVERVRAAEAELREQGAEQRVVVAVHEATGEVAGLTEVAVYPHRPDRCYQGDTAVRARHRGRGLGRWIKAEQVRWLLADHPGIERVQTSTNSDNTHMLRVNGELGYTTVRTVVAMSHDASALADALVRR